MSSDAITHSYKNVIKKLAITQQIPDDVIDRKPTINGARGMHPYIDDRFDLTLECIRRFYIGEHSPLFNALNRYKKYFDLFGSFNGYVDFFLLNDLVDEKENVRVYLPLTVLSHTRIP